MEQLIFLILIAIGSVISNIIQEKKKRKARKEAKAGRAEDQAREPRTAPSQTWPQTPGDWQETLRGMLQPEETRPIIPPVLPAPQTTPPPISRTVTTSPAPRSKAVVEVRPQPLERKSARAYAWTVQAASGTSLARKWMRNPQKLREAVIASVILGPPKALDEGSLRSW